MTRPILIAMILSLLAASMAAGEEARSVAVLPFENLSGDEAASHDATMLVMGALSRRGWAGANPAPVEEVPA